MMIKSKTFITLTLIIFAGLTFIETANSATAQSAARAVLKAKKCYNATPSTYKKGMLTSMSRAVTHWSDGNKFSKSNNKLKIVAGFMDGKVLDEKEVSVIATLPSLEEARAKIVGILATPAQKLVSILLAPGSKIANLARAKSLKN